MKYNYLILLLFCFSSLLSSAQHRLTGTVRDGADGSPIPFATAALLRPDSSAITGVITDDDGRFLIENVATGDYLLQVSLIGYKKELLFVHVPSQSDIGEIVLLEDAIRMEGVVVTGRRTLVEQKLDRIVVNVSGNVITSALNVQDVLKQMPGLVVDENGNVKLNGRPATIYVDGRPTRLPAQQVVQMLNGMQGDVVDRVELITNPSSRYEAALSSAIVNIRLKRDISLGLNGSASIGGGCTDSDFV
ncbi:MAG: TonB-dependent receptor, partial [Prevotellaceae bacterium]|nr:TonB-dependent receptor [Prevotellaceae bacterium]